MNPTAPSPHHTALYIGGRWQPATAFQPIVNPATEEVLATAPTGTADDMDRAVAAARTAFDSGPWPRLHVRERVEVLQSVLDRYRAHTVELAELLTSEMGSPITFSKNVQIPIAQMILEYFIGLAADYEFEEQRTGRSLPTTVIKEPVGVVAAIAPWNFPQALMMMKVAPALLAGCSVVAKPSPETALDALALAAIFDEAGLPEHVLSVVPAGREAGAHLVANAGVDRVSFTGSTAAGRQVAEVCGRDLRRCTLELGGKSALILLDDVDMQAALHTIRDHGFRNSGQTCTNQTRILVPRSRRDEMVDAICELVGSMQVGDPTDPATEVGPMVTAAHRDRVERYIQLGQHEGARVAVGGRRPAGLATGWYVEPTVLVDVHNDMRFAREEIFGPVVGILDYDDVDEAVAITNDSDYGLSAGVFGGDVERADAVARRIRSGMVIVNGQGGSFDGPFGGFKSSGIGRECGREGLEAFLEPKQLPLHS